MTDGKKNNHDVGTGSLYAMKPTIPDLSITKPATGNLLHYMRPCTCTERNERSAFFLRDFGVPLVLQRMSPLLQTEYLSLLDEMVPTVCSFAARDADRSAIYPNTDV